LASAMGFEVETAVIDIAAMDRDIAAAAKGETAETDDPAGDGWNRDDEFERDIAMAELSGDPDAVRATLTRRRAYWVDQMVQARRTADPRDDTEAARQVKALEDQIKALDENTKAQEDADFVSGEIGGRAALGAATVAAPGVTARY
jgi:hypothetical protein